MRRITLLLIPTLFLLAAACAEQEPAEDTDAAALPADTAAAMPEPAPASPLMGFAGTWEGTSYMDGGDTVQYTMTATDDTSGWMVELPDREPLPMRILSAEGDSVVTEIGPYESLFREGVMVTVRTVSRLEGDRMVGTMEAHYQGADADTVVTGRTEATRSM